MKVLTILGTRPEIIRLSRVVPILDDCCEHVLLHTGQNYDRQLNQVFFDDLDLREPDYRLDCRGETAMQQIAEILTGCEGVIERERPDRILILGDTNSALSAIVAKRLGIKVFHMEAGNRCFDDRVPEEINRRIVDHSSDILMPYTERSRLNLLREGIPGNRIYVTGNPIFEVLEHCQSKVDASNIMSRLGVEARKYFLATLHRAENVDVPRRLKSYIDGLQRVAEKYKYPVICSLHPRTRSRLQGLTSAIDISGITMLEPFGLVDFVNLEKQAFCVLSDSGTVQEECSIYGVPNVTLRDVTERPETVEAGSNIISGCDPDSIVSAVRLATSGRVQWRVPNEYLVHNVSKTVAKIVLSYWG